MGLVDVPLAAKHKLNPKHLLSKPFKTESLAKEKNGPSSEIEDVRLEEVDMESFSEEELQEMSAVDVTGMTEEEVVDFLVATAIDLGIEDEATAPEECEIMWKEEVKLMCEIIHNPVCEIQLKDHCHKEYETKCRDEPLKMCAPKQVCCTLSARRKRSNPILPSNILGLAKEGNGPSSEFEDIQLEEVNVESLSEEELQKMSALDVTGMTEEEVADLLIASAVDLGTEDVQKEAVRLRRSSTEDDCDYVDECSIKNIEVCEEVPTDVCEQVEEEVCSDRCKLVKMKVAEKICI